MKQNRREFLSSVSKTTIILPFLANCSFGQKQTTQNDLELIRKNAVQASNCNWCGAKDVPENVSWQTNFVRKNEPGEPLIISGTVYLPDGKTPAPNILIYAYHTDIKGLYGSNNEPTHGRFRGWMLTDTKGRYKLRTIKPAPYPSRKTPAHIHYTLTGKTFKEDWVDTVMFAGDELVTDGIRRELTGKGGFEPIIKLEKKSDGVLHGVRDIQLEKDWV